MRRFPLRAPRPAAALVPCPADARDFSGIPAAIIRVVTDAADGSGSEVQGKGVTTTTTTTTKGMLL